jgi:hypothetical protein
MLEAIITGVFTLVIGIAGGVISVSGKASSRMNVIEEKITQIELRVAEKYVQREELSTALRKMEDHMIRIENKLDQIVLRSG